MIKVTLGSTKPKRRATAATAQAEEPLAESLPLLSPKFGAQFDGGCEQMQIEHWCDWEILGHTQVPFPILATVTHQDWSPVETSTHNGDCQC